MMLIDKNIFEELCFGTISVRENQDGSIIPLRFTERSLSYYRRSESDRVRSLASAGVNMYCFSDAQRLMFEYALAPGSSQDLYGFDLYVDNQLYFHMQSAISNKPNGNIDILLPKGRKELRVYFPNLAITKFSSIELSGATVIEPINAKRWLMLGDSIVQGYTTHFPSMTLANILSQKLKINLINQGIAGEMFNADQLDGDLPFVPDRILVAYGTNDWNLRSRDEFEYEAEKFLNRLGILFPRTPIALISPIWRADKDAPNFLDFPFQHVDNFLRCLASSSKKVRFISGINLMPQIKELYFDHSVHPNELGFNIYAQNLLNALKSSNFI